MQMYLAPCVAQLRDVASCPPAMNILRELQRGNVFRA